MTSPSTVARASTPTGGDVLPWPLDDDAPTDRADEPDDEDAPVTRDWRRVGRDGLALTALLLVNGFAVQGQALWALTALNAGLVVAVLFAAALESVSLYLQAAAHRALLAGDAVLLRRCASYGVAGLVGWLNWSHWADSNPLRGAVYAGFSVISPWLWAIRARDQHRDALRARGLVDSHAVRFAVVRWVMFPRATFRAFRLAVWEGETEPARAIALLDRATPAPAPFTPGTVIGSTGRPAVPVEVDVQATADPAPAPPAPAVRRKTTKTLTAPARVERRPASDDEILAVVRPLVAEDRGRPLIATAVRTAGYQCGSDRLDALIATARSTPGSTS